MRNFLCCRSYIALEENKNLKFVCSSGRKIVLVGTFRLTLEFEVFEEEGDAFHELYKYFVLIIKTQPVSED